MAYVYKIINDINNKLYIGKTYGTLEKRFKEHIKDSKKGYKNRPLYNAMSKYGEEHFSIELIEECDNPEEREKYWIEYYGSFKNGYNATRGGDGRPYIDYELVIKTYEKEKSQKRVAEILNISLKSIRTILKNNYIDIIRPVNNAKAIAKYSLDNKLLTVYSNSGIAARELIKEGISSAQEATVSNRIRDCANHVRKTAYGFKWEFI